MKFWQSYCKNKTVQFFLPQMILVNTGTINLHPISNRFPVTAAAVKLSPLTRGVLINALVLSNLCEYHPKLYSSKN